MADFPSASSMVFPQLLCASRAETDRLRDVKRAPLQKKPIATLAKEARKKPAPPAGNEATGTRPAEGVSADFCPVVGVGASAGGLEAFTQLLQHLPKKTGLAFALVQHLDPEKASHLSDILSRATEMPVAEVKNGIHLEPNHVYVIPPNASMSVLDGTLAVAAREEGRARHFQIDHFFLRWRRIVGTRPSAWCSRAMLRTGRWA